MDFGLKQTVRPITKLCSDIIAWNQYFLVVFSASYFWLRFLGELKFQIMNSVCGESAQLGLADL